jgi:DNA-binding MarR family transcriptional regulator
MPDDHLLQLAADVRRGTHRLARRLRFERPEHAESPLQLGVLGQLYQRGPLTPGELAAAERIQPQSLTRTLASLEASQLIARQPDARDRRRSLLSLTEAGRQALLRDIRQRDSWLALAMARDLTGTERELLRLAVVLMGRLAEADQVTALRSPATRKDAAQAHGALVGPAGPEADTRPATAIW